MDFMTNAEVFKKIFGLYATELWAMSEKDFLKWLNSVRELEENPREGNYFGECVLSDKDCISRREVRDLIIENKHSLEYCKEHGTDFTIDVSLILSKVQGMSRKRIVAQQCPLYKIGS